MEQAEIPDVGGGPAPSAKVIDLSTMRSTPEKDAPPDIPKETEEMCIRDRDRIAQNAAAYDALNKIRLIITVPPLSLIHISLEQVTAVLSGKRVLAPPKDIMEVKNAYEIYDHLNELNPYSVEDLLLAHHVICLLYTSC